MSTVPVHAERLQDVIPDPQLVGRFVRGEVLVAVAPRPIPGQLEWRGGGGAGYFYAAVPVDPGEMEMPDLHGWMLRQWDDLHAERIEVFTEDEIWGAILADMEAEGIDLDEAIEMMDRPSDWGPIAHHRGLPPPLRMPQR